MSDQPNVRISLSKQEHLESSTEGRRWQAVPHLRTSNRKCSAASCGTVNRRLNEAVAAGRAKSSATWKVGNVSERAKVRRCTAAEDIVHQDGYFGRDALRIMHPMTANECVRDMVGATQVENQPRSCIED